MVGSYAFYRVSKGSEIYDFTSITVVLNVCVSYPPDSYVEALSPRAMVFGGGAFERNSV